MGHALAAQVLNGHVAGAEEQVGEAVGEHAVDLFGHRAVERTQPRLDVGDRDDELGRREGAGERRVGVAVDEHQRRADLADRRLDAGQHLARLHRVGRRTDTKSDVGPGQVELVEEDAGQLVVVVLAGVEQDLAQLASQAARDDRALDVLRPVADDRKDGPRSHRAPVYPTVRSGG